VGRRQWSPGDWGSRRPGMRPRVLVESSDAAEQWAMEEALRGAGYEVAVCLTTAGLLSAVREVVP
jgi:hypothetical protein